MKEPIKFFIVALFSFSFSILNSKCAVVTLNPGDDIQSFVNANPTGTVFNLNPGVYRLQTISPKDGDQFIGENGAVLNGSQLLTSFTTQGNYWIASGQTQQYTGSLFGSCQAGHDGCLFPEDLFIDDVPLERVGALNEVTTGKWYFDYNADQIYLMDDPTGKKVETGVSNFAFKNTAINVYIKNLVVEKYATPSQNGTIATGKSWIVDSNEIRLNHGTGLMLNNNVLVRNNYFHHMGQMGMGGGGDSIVFENNEVAFNNFTHFEYEGANGEAGGTKFSEATNLKIYNNYVHDNDGPGLWLDGQNYLWRIEGNRTSRNKNAGILIEISYDGMVRYNVVDSDAQRLDNNISYWWKGGIFNANSPNLEVYGNTVLNSNGIGGVNSNRTDPPTRGPFLIQNLNVHDNTIVENVGYAAGLVADPMFIPDVYTLWNNKFHDNRYKLSNSLTQPYSWYVSGSNYTDMTSTVWQQAGEDINGTWFQPTDATVPSQLFSEGDRVSSTYSYSVRSLPIENDSTTDLGKQPIGTTGTITKIKGPLYEGGTWWWQVDFDSGPDGWVPESGIAKANVTSLNNNIKHEETLKVYPNPVQDKLNIEILNYEGNFAISVVNILGEKIYTSAQNKHSDVISLVGFPAGYYTLVVEKESQQKISKGFIKVEGKISH